MLAPIPPSAEEHSVVRLAHHVPLLIGSALLRTGQCRIPSDLLPTVHLGGIPDWQPAHAHSVPRPDTTPAYPKQRHSFGVVSSRFLSRLSHPIGIRPPSPLHPPGRSTLSLSESAARPICGAALLQVSNLPWPRHLTSGQYRSAALPHPLGVDSSACLSDSGCPLPFPHRVLTKG